MGAMGLLGSLVGARGGSMVGRMLFGRPGAMVGGLVGSMLGSGTGSKMLGGLGGMFGGDEEDEATRSEASSGLDDERAEILVRAMCNAAKSDGHVDDAEVDAIVGQLGEVDADDERFLRDELQSPLDLDSFIASVPSDMADQVYAVSLMAIEVDNINEEHYLSALASGLNVDRDRVNSLHDELDIPRIF